MARKTKKIPAPRVKKWKALNAKRVARLTRHKVGARKKHAVHLIGLIPGAGVFPSSVDVAVGDHIIWINFDVVDHVVAFNSNSNASNPLSENYQFTVKAQSYTRSKHIRSNAGAAGGKTYGYTVSPDLPLTANGIPDPPQVVVG